MKERIRSMVIGKMWKSREKNKEQGGNTVKMRSSEEACHNFSKKLVFPRTSLHYTEKIEWTLVFPLHCQNRNSSIMYSAH